MQCFSTEYSVLRCYHNHFKAETDGTGALSQSAMTQLWPQAQSQRQNSVFVNETLRVQVLIPDEARDPL